MFVIVSKGVLDDQVYIRIMLEVLKVIKDIAIILETI